MAGEEKDEQVWVEDPRIEEVRQLLKKFDGELMIWGRYTARLNDFQIQDNKLILIADVSE